MTEEEIEDESIEERFKKYKEDCESIPFGWSKKQFMKWLKQEPYRRTKRRHVLDSLYSLSIGSLAGYALITGLLTGNYLYFIFTLPAIIHIIRRLPGLI